MEHNLFIDFLVVLDLMLFCFMALTVVYLMVFAIASRFYKTPVFEDPITHTRFLILIPAYKEDQVIISSVETVLSQSYPQHAREVIVIADRMQASTNQTLTDLGAKVMVFQPFVSLKATALDFAMKMHDEGTFDAVVILDADNKVEPSFLQQLNKAFSAGLKAIQTHRTAKKTTTDIALLDGISEEINNAIFRKGHVALGISSALIGSGMAFTYDWFEKATKKLVSAGEDKELELLLLKDRMFVHYLDDILVLDEKASGKSTFYNQRRRWLAAQFYALSKGIRWLPMALKKGNTAFVDKVVQWMMPPRVVVLGLVTCLAIVTSFIKVVIALKWWLLLLACISALGLAIPRPMLRGITFKSLLKLPVLFVLMVANYLRTKGAVQQFIHTKKE
jgi:cellulose synthase/poly-beta-1,6-N-acetylglucosamine synthase-like glycosyltransferase